MPDAATQVQGVVSPDQSQALFLVSQLAMPDHPLPGALRFPGLAPQARYRLRVVDHPDIQLV
ncbi:alpha-galactosidase domain protein, partial [Escherichia coli BCE008_MS-01]